MKIKKIWITTLIIMGVFSIAFAETPNFGDNVTVNSVAVPATNTWCSQNGNSLLKRAYYQGQMIKANSFVQYDNSDLYGGTILSSSNVNTWTNQSLSTSLRGNTDSIGEVKFMSSIKPRNTTVFVSNLSTGTYAYDNHENDRTKLTAQIVNNDKTRRYRLGGNNRITGFYTSQDDITQTYTNQDIYYYSKGDILESSVCWNYYVAYCGDGVVDDTDDYDPNQQRDGIDGIMTEHGFVQWKYPIGLNEECDDGNNVNGDGCSATCTLETPSCSLNANPISGNSPLNVRFTATKDSWAKYYRIDYGNGQYTFDPTFPTTNTYTTEGTYSPNLTAQNNYQGVTYTTRPIANCISSQIVVTTVSEVCGDGSLNDGEQCDDGNTDSNDGCNSACELESPSCNIEITHEGDESITGYSIPFIYAFPGFESGFVISGTYDSISDPIRLEFGDGTGVDNPTLPQYYKYQITGTVISTLTVENNYNGETSIDLPTTNCTGSIELGYCGDNIQQSPVEQCDFGSINSDDILSSPCSTACFLNPLPETFPEEFDT